MIAPFGCWRARAEMKALVCLSNTSAQGGNRNGTARSYVLLMLKFSSSSNNWKLSTIHAWSIINCGQSGLITSCQIHLAKQQHRPYGYLPFQQCSTNDWVDVPIVQHSILAPFSPSSQLFESIFMFVQCPCQWLNSIQSLGDRTNCQLYYFRVCINIILELAIIFSRLIAPEFYVKKKKMTFASNNKNIEKENSIIREIGSRNITFPWNYPHFSFVRVDIEYFNGITCKLSTIWCGCTKGRK